MTTPETPTPVTQDQVIIRLATIFNRIDAEKAQQHGFDSLCNLLDEVNQDLKKIVIDIALSNANARNK